MGEPEVVLPLGDVVGKLVAEREPDPDRRAGAIDQIDPDDFGLFASVECERWTGQIAFRGREN